MHKMVHACEEHTYFLMCSEHGAGSGGAISRVHVMLWKQTVSQRHGYTTRCN